MKPPRFHRRDQTSNGCGFPLHCNDEATAFSEKIKCEFESEFKASNPGT